MPQNQNVSQKATEGATEEQVAQCESGQELIPPREMVGYLRALEEGVDLPPGMEEHLEGCRTCNQNWAHIRRTDPILRKYRVQRVEEVIEKVGEYEGIFGSAVSGEIDSPPADPAKVEEVQQHLSQASEAVEDEPVLQNADQILSDEIPKCDDVLKLFATIQAIEDKKKRCRVAQKVAALFGVRVERERARAGSDQIFDSLLQSDSRSIDFSELKFTTKPELEKILNLAAVLVASLPFASYFPDAVRLEKSKSKVLFQRNLKELQAEFWKESAKFNAQQAPRPRRKKELMD